MGIKGLFKYLDIKRCNFSNLENFLENNRVKYLAIDSNCWLHKCKFQGGKELAIDGDPVKAIKAFMNYFKSLIESDVICIFVFDGKTPEYKYETHLKRRKDFDEKNKIARQKFINNCSRDVVDELLKYVCVNVIKEKLFEYLEEVSNFFCYQSTYESDTELAKMSLSGYVDIILTEDTDLIVYGCKKILFKLKWNCVDLFIRSDQKIIQSLGNEKFIMFCILSGCDYVKLIGVGSSLALKLVSNEAKYRKFIENVDSFDLDLSRKIKNAYEVFKLENSIA
jgi:exonuclease-1